MRHWLGIDIGGTFTDFALYDTQTGELTGVKVASTPHDFAEAVRLGLERLRDEHGYTGCESIVRAAVHDWRKTTAEVFVPLSHPPGEAQVDFGHAEVTPDGVPARAALFVLTLPYSDPLFYCAYPEEYPGVRVLRPGAPADQLGRQQGRDRQGQHHQGDAARA